VLSATVAKRVADHLLGAGINAIPAQNALAVFHRAILDHRVDVQAHRAVLRTLFAIDAAIGVHQHRHSVSFEHPAHAHQIACCDGVRHSIINRAFLLAPGTGPAMQLRHPIRLRLLQMRTQQVGKKTVMVIQPSVRLPSAVTSSAEASSLVTPGTNQVSQAP
jgi:hypothetical protein